jgi:phenylacetate-CoA ligase
MPDPSLLLSRELDAGDDAGTCADAQLLATFRTVAATMPWYRALLAEQGVTAESIHDLAAFTRRCPLLTKQNTFDRFTIRELAATTPLPQLASVLTSSGHGGRFSFGLHTREQEQTGAGAIDAALDAAFGVRDTPTLALNCLPMGVTFQSRCMTVATTSVREDMAVALIEAFGDAYAQVLVVADPLFLKRLVDYARTRGLDWRRHRLQVVVGEEVFGEHFRTYMAQRLGLNLAALDGSWLMSSFGVGELGLHLCYETRATVALRRLARTDHRVAEAVFGPGSAISGSPMVFTYDPRRLHLEIESPAADGYGRMTVSMLDAELPIPLLRYQTGDIACVLDPAAVAAALHARGVAVAGELPRHLIALRGRERDTLPNGAHVATYKDAVYADHEVADRLTGAVRLTFDQEVCTMHVQLVPGGRDDRAVAATLRDSLPSAARPARIEVWPYEQFPFGMTLDYERKFVGYSPKIPSTSSGR